MESALTRVLKRAPRRGCLTGTRKTLPSARPCASWQGPAPLSQRQADPRPAGGQKALGPRPTRLYTRHRRAPTTFGACSMGLGGSVAQGRGKRGAFRGPARTEAERQNPNHQRRCHGKGHRPCHSATLTPCPPRAGQAFVSLGAGRTGLGGSVARGRGKRGAFRGPAQRGNPFPRIGKSFPAGRRSDCFFSTLLKAPQASLPGPDP
jgi:hypothetical protein